jgi:nucleoid-associated protein YejK
MNDDLSVEKLQQMWQLQDAQIELAKSAFSAGYQLGVSTFRVVAVAYLKQAGLSTREAKLMTEALDAWQAATLSSEAKVADEMFRRIRGE